MNKILKAICLLTAMAASALELGSLYCDNAILQRDEEICITGFAEPGEKVTVSLGGNNATCVADGGGNWLALLPAMPAGGPFELSAAGAKDTVKASNVLLGDVWLMAGQSNMEFIYYGLSKEARKAPMTRKRYNDVRCVSSLHEYAAEECPRRPVKWMCSDTADMAMWSVLGTEVVVALRERFNVPVGYVNASIGGSRIGWWMSKEALKATGLSYAKKLNEPVKMKDGKVAIGNPASIYNTNIAPIKHFRFKGVVWYQGEYNVGDLEDYTPKLRELLKCWRQCFDAANLQFYIVQIPAYDYWPANTNHRLQEFCEMQRKYTEGDGNAHLVEIYDLGEAKEIHPQRKLEAAKRITDCVLYYSYGDKNAAALYPRPEKLVADGNRIIVNFKNAKTLSTSDGQPANGFEIAGADGVFKIATAVLDGNKCVLTAEGVAAPVAARFCWNNAVMSKLYNERGLPPGPFSMSLK